MVETHCIFENLVNMTVRLPCVVLSSPHLISFCKPWSTIHLPFLALKVRSGSEFGSKSGAIFSDTDPTWQKVPYPTRSGFTPLKSIFS